MRKNLRNRRIRALPLLLLASLWPHAAAAGDPLGARLGRHLLESPQLLDLGARRWLEDRGVILQLFYNEYLGWEARGAGGDAPGHSGSYDFFGRIDAVQLLGLPGLSLLLLVKCPYDEQINEDVGALYDPVVDSDFDSGFYVDQLWL